MYQVYVSFSHIQDVQLNWDPTHRLVSNLNFTKIQTYYIAHEIGKTHSFQMLRLRDNRSKDIVVDVYTVGNSTFIQHIQWFKTSGADGYT